MPSNRRPSTPGASPRPGGSRSGSARSAGRARGSSGPTTSRTDAGTSGRSGAGTAGTGSTKDPAAAKGSAAAKSPGAAKGAGKRPTAPRKPSSTSTPAGGPGASAGSSAGRTPRAPRSARPTASRAPALADRRRSRYGLLLPEVVTVRSLVIAVVVLLAVVLLLPTVRAYVNQTGELRALRAEVAAAEAERDALEVELGRWDDEAYVVAQARDRLSFVMPGERAWRVIDPDTVVDVVDPETGRRLTDGPVGVDPEDGAPWYVSVWRSVQLAGEQPAPGGGDGDVGTEPGDGPEAPPTDGGTP